jgi:hypothetical protein
MFLIEIQKHLQYFFFLSFSSPMLCTLVDKSHNNPPKKSLVPIIYWSKCLIQNQRQPLNYLACRHAIINNNYLLCHVNLLVSWLAKGISTYSIVDLQCTYWHVFYLVVKLSFRLLLHLNYMLTCLPTFYTTMSTCTSIFNLTLGCYQFIYYMHFSPSSN